jgi:hypothetical protein
MRQFIRHLAAALLAALILAVPAQAQTEVKDAPDPYVHRVAGVRFPEALPGFSRGRVFEYDEQGADASVGYHPQDYAGRDDGLCLSLAGQAVRLSGSKTQTAR